MSRNGETVGPVEESQIVMWVQGGVSDGMVRDEAGGPWTPVSESPFAHFRSPAQLPQPANGTGGSVVRSRSNRIVLLVVGLLLVASIGGFSWLMGRTSPGDGERIAPRTAESVSFKELVSEYSKNEVRGDARFKGKRVAVTGGRVVSIDRGALGGMSMMIGTGALLDFGIARCELGTDQAQKLVSYSKGDNVNFQGVVSGLILGVVAIRECEVD